MGRIKTKNFSLSGAMNTFSKLVIFAENMPCGDLPVALDRTVVFPLLSLCM
jgi:hypothetical protein